MRLQEICPSRLVNNLNGNWNLLRSSFPCISECFIHYFWLNVRQHAAKTGKLYASQKSCLCLDTSPVTNVATVTGELSVQPPAGQAVTENGWIGWLLLVPFVTGKVYLACRHQCKSPAGLPAVGLGYWQLSVKINLKSQGQVCLPATMLTGSEADCLDILCYPEGWNAEKTREGGAQRAIDGFGSWETCGQFMYQWQSIKASNFLALLAN